MRKKRLALAPPLHYLQSLMIRHVASPFSSLLGCRWPRDSLQLPRVYLPQATGGHDLLLPRGRTVSDSIPLSKFAAVDERAMLVSVTRDLSGYGSQLPEIEPGTFSQASFVTNL